MYSLIITEKPDAASRIASALDVAGKARKLVDNTVPYYVAKGDRKIVVVPALGQRARCTLWQARKKEAVTQLLT